MTLPLLAALTPDGIEQRIIYETVQNIPYGEHWDLVGLTAMGSGIVRAWQIADAFRKRGIKTVIGGIAASLGEPEWSLEHADAVVIGEAETVWSSLIRDFAAGENKKIYWGGCGHSLVSLPVPRYDLMKASKIGLWRPVQATRGCPFSCGFCSVTSFYAGVYRKRPVRDIVRDVRAAKCRGTRHIAFVDDNIGADPDFFAELCEALIPEKITWMSQSSLQITERTDLMKLAKRSGLRLLSFGIESTNPGSLATINKSWNRPERYLQAIHALRTNGIDVSTEMIVGLDEDAPDVFEETYRFIMEAGISVPRIHIMTPVPGTPLFEKLRREGRILSTDFSQYTGSKAVYVPMRIERTHLEKEYWRLYRRLYSVPSMLKRIIPNKARLNFYMRLVVWASNIKYRGHIRRKISPGIL